MASRGERTRQAMLDAGVDIARQSPVQAYLSFLRPEDVAAAAGRSKSTFFHHWPSMAAYIDDLVREAVSPMSDQPLASILRRSRESDQDERDVLRSLRAVATGAFEALASNRNFPFFLLAAAAGDETASAELGRANRELDAHIGEIVDEYLESQGRRIRDPFTADIMVATIYAIGVGLATRARSDADRITGILFADVIAGLLPALVTSAEDRLALDDYVDLALQKTSRGAPVASLLMPDDIVAAAAGATNELRTHITPVAEASLVEIAEDASSWGADQAMLYLERLHGELARHSRTCLFTTVVVHAIRVADVSPSVADPLRDSGLDGVTSRALGFSPTLSEDPHLPELVRNVELRLMRLVFGADPTPIDRCLRETRAILTLDG